MLADKHIGEGRPLDVADICDLRRLLDLADIRDPRRPLDLADIRDPQRPCYGVHGILWIPD